MAWLIRTRAVHQGRLDQLLKLQSELTQQVAVIESELAAIDAVIPFHEVKVDPSGIAGVQPRSKRLVPHGQMTKVVLRCLKDAKGRAIHTEEVSQFFAREVGVDLGQYGTAAMNIRVRTRLKVLCNEGLVRRHHIGATGSATGSWSLVLDQSEDLDIAP